jgi:hypothetical protein
MAHNVQKVNKICMTFLFRTDKIKRFGRGKSQGHPQTWQKKQCVFLLDAFNYPDPNGLINANRN